MIRNNPAKMPITSTNHEWAQFFQIEQEATSMAVTSKNITDKPPQDHQQPLRCPRCDSSNTKFCYYNNYSLSQPRHFCKACKRYWTRGGTLRNVPVGGGCRKNKRIKRPAAVSGDTPTSLPNPSTGQSDSYIVARTPSSMASLPFPSLQSQMPSLNYEYLSIPRSSSTLDLPPHFSSLNWLNFPAGASHPSNNSDDFDQYQHTSFTYNPSNQFHESMTSSSLWTSDHHLTSTFLGSSSAPTDLLASTFNQQKLVTGLKEPAGSIIPNGLQVLFPMGDHSNTLKGVKMEEENPSMDNKMDWQVPHCNSSIHENISSSSNMNWNLAGVLGSWAEANAHGSLTPLL